jgi:pyruvate,water dikinase
MTAARNAHVIPLDAIRGRDAPSVGAKAANLARMIRFGLPVPPGLCVTGAAYREHVNADRVRSRLQAALAGLGPTSPAKRRAHLADVRSAIVKAPVSSSLRAQLREHRRALGDVPLAVRSSATDEDAPDRSFAGQHDSCLGVVGEAECLQAVKQCWASLWNDRAFEYRRKLATDHLEAVMAVIVQTLVPAEAAGVVFTADPITGQSGWLIIEGGFGLGEPIVSGKAAPDRIVLNKDDLAVSQRTIANKTRQVLLDAKGRVQERAVPPEKAQRPCLEDAVARRLAELALKAEHAFGFPLDLEWAAAGDMVYLLQARPVTTGAAAKSWEDRQVWTNANAGEVLPDVMTPVTESVLIPVVRRLFSTIGGWLGVNLDEVDLFGVIAGRVYFNLNTFAGFGQRVPVLRNRSMSELLGGRQDAAIALGQIEIPQDAIPDLDVSWLRAAVRLPRVLLGFLSHSPRRGQRFVDRAGRDTEAMWQSQWRSLEDGELRDRLTAIINTIADPDGFLYLGVGVVYAMSLFNLCRRWLGDSGDAVASRLLSGLGSLDNAEAGLALWRLAALAHEHPDLEAIIRTSDGFESLRPRIAATEGGREFLARWDAFLWRYGHHTRGEAEVRNARWSEQPDYVLDLVRGCLGGIGQNDPVGRSRRLAEDRASLTAQCRERLRNPVKRLCFDFVLRQAQRGAPIRENLKDQYIRRLALVRAMLLELGRSLTKRGVIQDRDDVFFLRLDELESVCGHAAPDVREKIGARRAEYEKNLAVTPPAVVVGRFDPDRYVADPVDKTAEVLLGVAVSPGIVTGPARVILRAGVDQVRAGEVLVAPFTDPGWTPYFLNAAAIVMDMGGLLSHGSIVAREYGIPCVVNVGPATKIIATGQMIRVDGDRGEVRILGKGGNKTAGCRGTAVLGGTTRRKPSAIRDQRRVKQGTSD